MQKVTSEQFADNALWKLIETIARTVVSIVISTIIARHVAPEAYGVVALTTVFITFSDIFILNGFNVALVRKEKIEESDYSTVMLLGLAFSAVIYIIIFFAAPFLADFYSSPELKNVLRVITTLIFFQSISTVIRAKATRELSFKKMAITGVLGLSVSSSIALIMALNDMGVWALVAQQVIFNAMDMVLLSLIFKWKYKFLFSFKEAKKMIRFTAGVLSASFLDFFGNNVSGLVIGKVYDTTELGYVNRGNMYPETVGLNIYNSINSVLLPTLASKQDNIQAMKDATRKVVSLTEYIILPIMFGLASVADRFVTVIITDEWAACIPVLIFSCVSYAVNPIRAICYTVYYAKGESRRSFYVEIVRISLMLTNLIVTVVIMRSSIYVLCLINALIAFITAMVAHFHVCRSISYTYSELVFDMLPSLIMTAVMVVEVRLLSLLPVYDWLILALQVIVGGMSYICMSVISKNKNYYRLLGYIKNKLFKRKKTEK